MQERAFNEETTYLDDRTFQIDFLIQSMTIIDFAKYVFAEVHG